MKYIDKNDICGDFEDFLEEFGQRLREWEKIKKITRKEKSGKRTKVGKAVLLSLFVHLRRQQKGLCIYCEQLIPEKNEANRGNYKYAHFEHVKKQELFKDLIFKQGNLSVSCNGFDCRIIFLEPNAVVKEFCGHFKDGNYNELETDYSQFIHPFEVEDISDYFEYEFSEDFDKIYIRPNPNREVTEQKKAGYMIDLLGLQHETLCEMRREEYDITLEQMNSGIDIEDYLSEEYEELPSFHSMLKEKFLQ